MTPFFRLLNRKELAAGTGRWDEIIRRIQEAGRRIDLVVGITETELHQDTAGGGILGVMAGEKTAGSDSGECIADDRAGRFRG